MSARFLLRVLVAVGFGVVAQGTAIASNSATLTIGGTDAIFLAGRTDVTIAPPGNPPPGYPLRRVTPPGPYAEAFPVQVSATSGQSFQFAASGGVNYNVTNNTVLFGPDGVTYDPPLDITNLGGISGYYGPFGGLLGVFLNDNDPQNSTAPATLNFTTTGSTNFTALSPALSQIFFIGDGLTGTGTGSSQTFYAPTGATRLFLGVADAPYGVGSPGGYDDNAGSLSVTVTPSSVPEPSGALLIIACGSILLSRGRCRQSWSSCNPK